MKKYERYLIFCFFFLAVLRVNAQKTINIGAIIEDDKFLWTMESMDLYSDSTIITWKVKNKLPKIRMQLPQHVQIKDLNSGTIFQSSFIGEKIDSKNTVFFKREFEFQRFTTSQVIEHNVALRYVKSLFGCQLVTSLRPFLWL